MSKQSEEKINRRMGRIQMLLTDLGQLPEGYQPTEREAEQAGAVVVKLAAVYGGPIQPAPEVGACEKAQAENQELREKNAGLETTLAETQGALAVKIQEVENLHEELNQARTDLEAATAKKGGKDGK